MHNLLYKHIEKTVLHFLESVQKVMLLEIRCKGSQKPPQWSLCLFWPFLPPHFGAPLDMPKVRQNISFNSELKLQMAAFLEKILPPRTWVLKW